MEQVSIKLAIKGNYKVIGKSKTDHIIAGYASIAEVDLENQFITTRALEDGVKTLIGNENFANLNLSHNNIQIGQVLESYKGLKTHVDDKGLFIVARIREDLEVSKKTWNRILSGELRAFSIAGEIIESHNSCNKTRCIEVIDKIHIFEISVCEEPVNTKSGFTIISKNVCKEKYNNIDDIMTEKEEEKTESSEKKESETETQKSEEKTEDKTEETKTDDTDTETKSKKDEDEEKKDEDDDADDKEDKEDKKKSSDETMGDFVRRLEAIEEVISQTFSETKEEKKDDSSEDTKVAALNEAWTLISESIDMEVEEVKKALDALKSKDDNVEKKQDDEVKTETKSEEKTEEKTDETKPAEKSVDETQEVDGKEFKLAIKSRDDAINGYKEKIENLESKVKELENSEQESKTKVESKKELSVPRSDYVVEKGGVIYKDE